MALGLPTFITEQLDPVAHRCLTAGTRFRRYRRHIRWMDYSPEYVRELVIAMWKRAAEKAVNAEASRAQVVAMTETAQLANRSATARREHSDSAHNRQIARSA